MKKFYISNAFSLNMIGKSLGVSYDMVGESWEPREIKNLISEYSSPVISMSGEATRDLFNAVTGCDVSADRNNIVLEEGDTILVMQYNGPRLEAGLTAVPAGGTLSFHTITVYTAVGK